MLEIVKVLVESIVSLPIGRATLVLLASLVAWAIWVLKDRLKELAALRGASTQCDLCRFKISEEVRTTTNRVRDLRLELLDRQMKSFENLADRVVYTVTQGYMALVQHYIPAAVIECQEVRLMQANASQAMHQILLPGIRQILKENHLAQRTPEEWVEYKTTTLATVRTAMLGFTAERYAVGYAIPRDEVFAFFTLAYDGSMEPALHLELDRARDLAIKYESDIAAIETHEQ